MIQAKDLRVGNLVLWNPKLANPKSTLPPMQIEVFSIMPDKIAYVFPNIENRVEPFEDDVVQMGTRFKEYSELEAIHLTVDILLQAGFQKNRSLLSGDRFEKGDLHLKHMGEYFSPASKDASINLSIKYLHQLQNVYYALTGNELEVGY